MTHSTRSSNSRTTLIFAIILLFLFSFAVFNISCIFLHRPDLAWLDYNHESESLIEATRVPKIISSEAIDIPTNVHIFQNDGDVTVGVNAPRHPVFDILEYTNKEWKSLLAAHGGDEAKAVLQYRLQSSEKKGLALWLVANVANAITSVDLFAPISPSLLSPRQREAEILPDTFTLIIRSGVPSAIFGNLTASVSEEHRTRRVQLLLDGIRPFVSSLPDLRATFNVLPYPRHALHPHVIQVLHALSADHSLPNSHVKFRSQAEPSSMDTGQGRPIHAEDLKLLEDTMTRRERWTWENACYAQLDTRDAPEEEDERSDFTPPIRFVASPQARSDPCVHRSLAELHSSYESIHTTYHTRISPIISETTAPWASDVLLPPLDFFASDLQDAARSIPWHNKTAGLFWRGPGPELSAPYPIVQQQRLLHFTRQPEEHDIIIPTDSGGFLIDRKRVTDVVTFDFQQGSGGSEEAGRKFLIELGGGAQMRTKMAGGSLVFRPLLLGDWVSEHTVPWVHYVPVQPDLSDLPSLTAFFERHDTLAMRIADAGQAWAREQLSQARVRDDVRQVLEGWTRIGLGLREQR